MFILFKHISVIPATGFYKIHSIPSAQLFYLIFRKARIFLQVSLIHHGKLPEHIQRGMHPVFLDRQDARHIGKGHIGLIFKKIPKEIKILFLCRLVLLLLAHHTIPFVNQKNKLLIPFDIYFLKCCRQDGNFSRNKIPISFPKFLNHRLFQVFHRIPFPCPEQELLHIQINHIILIQMLSKGFVAFYFQSRKQLP